MKNFDTIALKTVRWTGWPLLVLAAGFLVTGYALSGRYGMDALLAEQDALALHRLLHLPFGVCLLLHTLPAVYLSLARRRWFRPRRARQP